MKSKLFTGLLLGPVLFVSSCKKDIEGCKDSSAINYNSESTINDDSCLYDTDGDGIYDSEEILVQIHLHVIYYIQLKIIIIAIILIMVLIVMDLLQ